MKRKNWFIAIF